MTIQEDCFDADELEHVTEPGPCPLCGRPTIVSDRGGRMCVDEDSTCWRGGEAAMKALERRRQEGE